MVPESSLRLFIQTTDLDAAKGYAAAGVDSVGAMLLAANGGADLVVASCEALRRAGLEPAAALEEMAALCRSMGGRPKLLVDGVESADDVLAAARAGAWATSVDPRTIEALLGAGPSGS